MPSLAIIADDLTGANDTGVQFAKFGLRTHVLISISGYGMLPTNADVIVINTDSRGMGPRDAYQRVAIAAQELLAKGVSVIYKKVDSTLRGNLGAEIDAVLDVFGFECAIVVPAFPRNGRITAGGYHLLNQIPLQCTEIAHDPKSPVTESRLAAVLRSQSRYCVEHVELADVLAGPEVIKQRLIEGIGRGNKLIAFDATDEAHLSIITQTIHQMGKRILWVGSAGMAEKLPELYSIPGQERCEQPTCLGLPVLIVAGSISSVTQRQVRAFLESPGSAGVMVNCRSLVEDGEAEVARCVEAARCYLRQGRHTALITMTGNDSVASACAVGAKVGMAPMDVSDLIAQKLGDMAWKLAEEKIEGVFLTGGDTAANVCMALGAGSMEVYSEVATGIPLGRLSAGPCRGLKVVTKAGAFGDEQAIIKAIQIIQNQ